MDIASGCGTLFEIYFEGENKLFLLHLEDGVLHETPSSQALKKHLLLHDDCNRVAMHKLLSTPCKQQTIDCDLDFEEILFSLPRFAERTTCAIHLVSVLIEVYTPPTSPS